MNNSIKQINKNKLINKGNNAMKNITKIKFTKLNIKTKI